LAEFLIKVEYVSRAELTEKSNYLPGGAGIISSEYVKGSKGNVKLSWQPVYEYSHGERGDSMSNTKFKIVLSNNKFAVLDQVCAVKRRINVF
jgi:hypothetical protein